MTSREPDESTASPQEPLARPLFVPRGLVMLSALWVFATWILLFGFRPPVQPQAASYGPTLEILFAAIGVGIAIGWPLLRLSGRPSSAPLLQSVFDAFAVFVLLQVVVWPLRLVSSWSLPRTWLVVATIGLAVALSGAVLALAGSSSSRRVRTGTMAAIVVAAVLPIAIGIVGEAVAPTGSPGFASAPEPGSVASWRTVLEAAVPASSPTLLWRCAAAIPLDPASSEWALVRHGAILAAGLWAVAIAWRVRHRMGHRMGTRMGTHRPDAHDPLS